MKKLHQILLLAVSFTAWSVGAAAQERTVELVKDGQVVFSILASEIEYMTVVNRLHVPGNVHGAVADGKVTVTWDAVDGATSYKVFRSADGNNFSPIGTSSGNSFTDNAPLSGASYYRILALGADGIQSDMSAATLPVTSDVQEESGIYLGLLGFNQNLQHYPIRLLTRESKQGYYDFIDTFCNDNDCTPLYYAVDQAISTLQGRSYPSDLNNVYVLTYTDGIDNYSLDIYDEIEFGRYSSTDEYGDSVRSRLTTEKVSGIRINSYAKGLQYDAMSRNRLKAELNRIAFNAHDNGADVFDEMPGIYKDFREMAGWIARDNLTQSITISIMGGLDNGERVRFTFDLPENSTSADNSNMYIEGTYQRTSTTTRKLTNITAKGLTLEEMEVVGTKNTETGLFDFTFKEVATISKDPVDVSKVQEWWGSPWLQKDTEFSPDVNVKEEMSFPSVAIILVLDCTKSFGDKFKDLQLGTKELIAKLLDLVYGEAPDEVPDYNGHEYVDLGLPSGIKWATCNVGAFSPSDRGNYYAWGETTPKPTYTESNSMIFNLPCFEEDISGNPLYDAARANWGGSWRLPSEAEWRELLEQCTWAWTSRGGYDGYKVTGSNGNSIFLPAAGSIEGSSLNLVGSFYWSSTSCGDMQYAYGLLLYDGDYVDHRMASTWNYDGNLVRPVSD